MATAKTSKARAEVEKARQKLIEQQAKLKELETKQTEFENMDIVDIVRGMSIPLDDLAAILQSLKNGVIPDISTSGQLDPKLSAQKNDSDTDSISENNEQNKENESE
jgi:arsenate reductase-like glutaredoxin family protein